MIACRALDRVLRAGHYWIPHWYKASHWIAYWDVFGRPTAQPRYFRGIPETWWYDPDKAAKIERAGINRRGMPGLVPDIGVFMLPP